MPAKPQGKPSYSNAREMMQQREASRSGYVRLPSGMNFLKVEKSGALFLDIIPYKVKIARGPLRPGQLHYERPFFVHRRIGPDFQKVACPALSIQKPCPICEYIAAKNREPGISQEMVDQLTSWKAQERQLWYVVDAMAPEKGIQLLDFSYWMFGKILFDFLALAEPTDEYDRFFHLENGWTLKLGMMAEQFKGGSYYKVSSIEIKPRRRQYTMDILKDLPSLDDLIVFKSYDDLRELFRGEERDEEMEGIPNGEEETPFRVGAPPARRRPVADEEDDSWIDRPGQAAEDEEVKPPRQRKPAAVAADEEDSPQPPRRTAKALVAEPEEDDEWEDEDEIEPPPPKGKKPKAKPEADDDWDEEEPWEE